MSSTSRVIALLSLAHSGCIYSQEGRDYYSEVIDVCGYLPTGGGTTFDFLTVDDFDYTATTLTPECKAALEDIIPYDDESFADAPAGFKDKLTESFQYLLALPMQRAPENRILGVAPYSMPLAHACAFMPFLDPAACFVPDDVSRNINQHTFNYVLNRFNSVSYGGFGNGSTTARYTVGFPIGDVTFFDPFWQPDLGGYLLRTPLLRAAVLVHEARHGDGNPHVDCSGDLGIQCDPDLTGAYGMGLTYMQLVLRGSVNLKAADGKPALSGWDVTLAAATYAAMMPQRLWSMPPEVADLMNATKSISANWVMEQEGIERLPVLDEEEEDDSHDAPLERKLSRGCDRAGAPCPEPKRALGWTCGTTL